MLNAKKSFANKTILFVSFISIIFSILAFRICGLQIKFLLYLTLCLFADW